MGAVVAKSIGLLGFICCNPGNINESDFAMLPFGFQGTTGTSAAARGADVAASSTGVHRGLPSLNLRLAVGLFCKWPCSS